MSLLHVIIEEIVVDLKQCTLLQLQMMFLVCGQKPQERVCGCVGSSCTYCGSVSKVFVECSLSI